MLSRRTRTWIGLIGGILAAALAWNGSGTTGSRSGNAIVVRKTIQTAGVPGYEEGARRLVLDHPPPGTPQPGLLVPPRSSNSSRRETPWPGGHGPFPWRRSRPSTSRPAAGGRRSPAGGKATPFSSAGSPSWASRRDSSSGGSPACSPPSSG